MKYIWMFLLSASLVQCYSRKPKETGLEGKLMPSFDIQLIDTSKHFNTSNIPKNKPTVILFISPSCPYCKALTKEIITDINSLQDINFYIITGSAFINQLKQYYVINKLDKFPNITVGYDYTTYFEKYFQVDNVPYTVIYDSDKFLKRAYTGNISTNLIKDIALK